MDVKLNVLVSVGYGEGSSIAEGVNLKPVFGSVLFLMMIKTPIISNCSSSRVGPMSQVRIDSKRKTLLFDFYICGYLLEIFRPIYCYK